MFSAIRHKLVQWDHVLWYYMNTQWHNSFFDAVIPFLRNQYFWIPLYFFLLLFIPYKFKKKGWIWCVGFLIAFGLSDQVCITLLKPYFHRLRPCNTPSLAHVIHLIVPCGPGLSFPSSHASNHFAMGIFSAVTLSKRVKWIWPVALAWALSVSFSQVYVGVHYPLDVTFGALVGTISGACVGMLFNKYFSLAEPATTVTENT